MAALGLPSKLTMSAGLWSTICRDRIAVGTILSETARICSPKPSRILSQTAAVASGVTSRSAGPVPPVVTTMQHFSASHNSLSVCSMTGRSSGMMRGTASQAQVKIWLRQSLAAGAAQIGVDAFASPIRNRHNSNAADWLWS